MNEIKIITLDKLERTSSLIGEFQDIFFKSSSRQNFNSAEEKEQFFKTWTSFYTEQFPQYTYFAFENNRLVGYLTGHLDSINCKQLFFSNKFYSLFEDQFSTYPAHLHINCHPDFRGRGVGCELIKAFELDLQRHKVSGVHIITAPKAANVFFYSRSGFDFQLLRGADSGCQLLFMGKFVNAQ